MEWKTSISDISDREERIRGYLFDELIGRVSFSEAIWLVLRGALPAQREKRMLDAILVSMIEHGVGTASAMTTRIIASSIPSVTAAAAGGLLTIGEYHGGAISSAARMLREALAQKKTAASLVARYKEQKKRIPGFGHRVLTRDPRAEKLDSLADEYEVAGPCVALMKDIGEKLNRQSSKPLPLNVDGMTAAILSDLGLDHALMNGFFAIARLPGLIAHAAEEHAREKPLRRLMPEESIYDGAAPRDIDAKND